MPPKSETLVCLGGPCDGQFIELSLQRKTWLSPNQDLYHARRVYCPQVGYRRVLVYDKLKLSKLDQSILKENAMDAWVEDPE